MYEVKFRAWSEYSKAMVSWEAMKAESGLGEVLSGDDKKIHVMQFTGLKDKNGREIYEVDILKTHNQNNIVKCEYGSFMLTGLHEDKYERTYAHLKDYLVDVTIPDVNGSRYDGVTVHLEIIGNIYENPELLEFEL